MVTLEMDVGGKNVVMSRGPAVSKAVAEFLMPKSKVAAIVLGYNGANVIEPCLESLFRSTYQNLEVIVVDNGSTDNTAEIVREKFPQARLISTGKNLGFAGGNNVGIRATDADIVILLNDDTTIEPDAIDAIVRFAESDPDVGIVGCKILYPDGKTIQHAGAAVLPNGLTKHYGYGEQDNGQFDRVFDVAYVTGAAIAIKREVLDKLGLLDAGYFPAYFEEADYCERARRMGYRVVYLPRAVVRHYESHASVKGSFSFFARYHCGRLRYVLKNFTARRLIGFVKEELRWSYRTGWREQRRPLMLAYLKTLLKLPMILWARRRDWVPERINLRIVKSAINFSESAFYNRLEGFSPIFEWNGARVRAVSDEGRFRLAVSQGERELYLRVAALSESVRKLEVWANGKLLGEVEITPSLRTVKLDILPVLGREDKGSSCLLNVVLRPGTGNDNGKSAGYRVAVKAAWVGCVVQSYLADWPDASDKCSGDVNQEGFMESDLKEYQRLVFGGQVVQEGDIDTVAKFKQMTRNIDLNGKRVLDIGCRRGGMCYQAWQAGASSVVGVDLDPALIDEARRLKAEFYPEAPVEFDVNRAECLTGEFDVAILSGAFHYITDVHSALQQMARVTKEVLVLDIWVVDDDADGVPMTQLVPRFDRAYWVPNRAGAVAMLGQFFEDVSEQGDALTPDTSHRLIFECRKPKAKAPDAVLVYGPPKSGKSRLGAGLSRARGYAWLSLDQLFFNWYYHHCGLLFNIEYMAQLTRGALHKDRLDSMRDGLRKWLTNVRNRDIVIEGLDMVYDDVREMVRGLLNELGWNGITEIDLGKRGTRVQHGLSGKTGVKLPIGVRMADSMAEQQEQF